MVSRALGTTPRCARLRHMLFWAQMNGAAHNGGSKSELPVGYELQAEGNNRLL
jgi:hypothetical protein